MQMIIIADNIGNKKEIKSIMITVTSFLKIN